jgi:hypothetical protein
LAETAGTEGDLGVDPKTGIKHAPPLKTKADWIKAGESVFDAARFYDFSLPVEGVRDPTWYRKTGTPEGKDGTIPFGRCVVRRKGAVELGNLSCAMCHTRVMEDGSILKGAQGNFPFDRSIGFGIRAVAVARNRPPNLLELARANELSLYATPWLRPDPSVRFAEMSLDEIASAREAIPPGVQARHRTSSFYPAQVPDLIGVKNRHYLDRTGLQQHRGIVDLMRYAALNQLVRVGRRLERIHVQR